MRIVFVTCPPGAGAGLVTSLLEERLIAGCNIVPGVRSLYRWKGAVCDEPEEVLLMETAADRVGALIERLTALHPYEVPKIVALDAAEVNAPYLAWVGKMTRPG